MNLKLNCHCAIPLLLGRVVNLRENVFDVIFSKSLLIPNISGFNRILHKISEDKKAPDRGIQKAIERALWMSPAGANPNNNIANFCASTHYRIVTTYDVSDVKYFFTKVKFTGIKLPS